MAINRSKVVLTSSKHLLPMQADLIKEMDAIQISVNKQLDGYTFSISPSVRALIKTWFPDAHPANIIFVSYDIKSGFEDFYTKLEALIYPAMLGIEKQSDLIQKIQEVRFVDTQTGKVLHTYKIGMEEK